MLTLLNKTFSIQIQMRRCLIERNFEISTIQDRIDGFECDSIRDDRRIVIESSVRSDCFEYLNVNSDRSRSGESVKEIG